jgi:transposase, IS5 family
MTTQRRRGQTSFDDWFAFGGIPRPEALMDPVLKRIDPILDDAALVDTVFAALAKRHKQSARTGRPSTPAEVVLRLLVLKHLRSWSYEQLQWEVTGNYVYRRFCRIDGGDVPDSKTMVRYGQLLDGEVLKQVFDRVVEVARVRGVSKGRRLRVDTTVVEAPIHYPTDSSLCADSVRVLSREMKKAEEAGAKLPFVRTDVRRSLARRALEIGYALRKRGDEAKQSLVKPYRRLLKVTARITRQAVRARRAALRAMTKARGKRRRALARAAARLGAFIPKAKQVIKQTRARVLRGVSNSDGKLLSIFETGARILRRGKLHKPTEFGALVKVQEAEGGLVTDVRVVNGHHDAELLVPSVERHVEVFGRPPIMVATDRGFYSGRGVRTIEAMGVRRVVVPFPGHRSAARVRHEHQRWFRRGRAWRAGGEARNSRLKHHFDMGRSRYRGSSGTPRTVYWAAISNNLVAIGRAA